MSETQAFWTIERDDGEPLRDFVIRTWHECFPGLSLDELEAIPPEQQAVEIVRDGYRSPYRFGQALREMVADDNSAIMAAYQEDGTAIYYTWGEYGSNGPTLAAFYNPARQVTGDVDYFEAVDRLGSVAQVIEDRVSEKVRVGPAGP